MKAMNGEASHVFMTILGVAAEPERRRQKAGRAGSVHEKQRASKLHGRLYAVQQGDDRRFRLRRPDRYSKRS
jgi:hypothetical protein